MADVGVQLLLRVALGPGAANAMTEAVTSVGAVLN